MKIGYYLLIGMVFLATACGAPNSFDSSSVEREYRTSAASHAPGEDPSTYKLWIPQLLTSDDHAGGFGWKKNKCFLCHSVLKLKELHAYSPKLSASFSKLGEEDVGVCLYCHGTNGLAGVTAETYQCMRCHSDSTIVTTAEMFRGYNMHDLNGDGRMENADCVVCHARSDMNGALEVTEDFREGASTYENISAFCLNCHDGNGAFGIMPPLLSTGPEANNLYSTYKGIGETLSTQKQTADIHGVRNGSGQNFAEFRGTYTDGLEVACLDCHQVHSSDNPFLITESGASATLADDPVEAATVRVTENDFTQLCALCHTSVGGAPTDNGLTEVTHPSTYSSYCTDCHYHGAGYKSGLF